MLTVHLKRFEYGGFGAKINKKVEYGTTLDLRPYMSVTKGQPEVRHALGPRPHVPCGCSVASPAPPTRLLLSGAILQCSWKEWPPRRQG